MEHHDLNLIFSQAGRLFAESEMLAASVISRTRSSAGLDDRIAARLEKLFDANPTACFHANAMQTAFMRSMCERMEELTHLANDPGPKNSALASAGASFGREEIERVYTTGESRKTTFNHRMHATIDELLEGENASSSRRTEAFVVFSRAAVRSMTTAAALVQAPIAGYA